LVTNKHFVINLGSLLKDNSNNGKAFGLIKNNKSSYEETKSSTLDRDRNRDSRYSGGYGTGGNSISHEENKYGNFAGNNSRKNSANGRSRD